MKALDVLKPVLAKSKMFVKANSPTILATVGVIGMVGTVVSACVATKKLDKVTEEAKKLIDDVKANVPTTDTTKYATELGKAYLKISGKYILLYAPTAILATLTVTSFLSSNKILKTRNAALTAAYTAVDGAFKAYRENVKEKYGEEEDKKLRFNLHEETVEKTVTDENGKTKKVKETVLVSDEGKELDPSGYARCFDKTCNGWSELHCNNVAFLRTQQAYANTKLKADGYLFLNDVYELLGYPVTAAGRVVGWLYDPENRSGMNGDNKVDFGLFDISRKSTRDWINGNNDVVLLDFNVDGEIVNKFELFDKKRRY